MRKAIRVLYFVLALGCTGCATPPASYYYFGQGLDILDANIEDARKNGYETRCPDQLGLAEKIRENAIRNSKKRYYDAAISDCNSALEFLTKCFPPPYLERER